VVIESFDRDVDPSISSFPRQVTRMRDGCRRVVSPSGFCSSTLEVTSRSFAPDRLRQFRRR
jgi:hypothetical protein